MASNSNLGAAKFRKDLISDGFVMFQFSVYMRHCPSRENAAVHISRIKSLLPASGEVGILTVTDKQYGRMELFRAARKTEKNVGYIQLELF